MSLYALLGRITLIVLLGIIAFLAPFWVTVLCAVVMILAMSMFVEAVVIVMMIEFVARSFVGFGHVGWLLLLLLIMWESNRYKFTGSQR